MDQRRDKFDEIQDEAKTSREKSQTNMKQKVPEGMLQGIYKDKIHLELIFPVSSGYSQHKSSVAWRIDKTVL